MMLSIFSCVYWPSVCLLWRNVCLGLLPPFFLGGGRCLLLLYWAVWTAYTLWRLILCQLFQFSIFFCPWHIFISQRYSRLTFSRKILKEGNQTWAACECSLCTLAFLRGGGEFSTSSLKLAGCSSFLWSAMQVAAETICEKRSLIQSLP